MTTSFNDINGKKDLLKKLDVFAIVASFLVLVLVVVMRQVKLDVPYDFSMLPGFHALLNSGVTICLIIALWAVKSGKITLHKRFVMTAMILSIVFLLSYVIYHITSTSTKYCGEGSIRYVYFVLLITHVVLAAVILPFILFTFNRAWAGFYETHRKMARWVFPVWLYVAITGPVCYWMLLPCY